MSPYLAGGARVDSNLERRGAIPVEPIDGGEPHFVGRGVEWIRGRLPRDWSAGRIAFPGLAASSAGPVRRDNSEIGAREYEVLWFAIRIELVRS
jgi:hypothetical protein